MKVWELIAKHSECPAGADVFVNMQNILNGDLLDFGVEGNEVILSGGDAEILNSDAETVGRLSDIADYPAQ